VRTCARCRSENFGDIKYCNFCGAQVRTPIPLDVYEGNPPLFGTAQAIPIPLDVVDPKLAYRYFLEGQKAFAVSDMPRAMEMFRRALDANPADETVKSFLRRAAELQDRLGDDGWPVEPPLAQQGPSEVAFVPSGATVKPLTTQRKIVKTTPSLVRRVPASATQSPQNVSPPPALRVISSSFPATTPEPLPIQDGPPKTFSEYLETGERDAWKEAVASGLITLGLITFACVLLWA